MIADMSGRVYVSIPYRYGKLQTNDNGPGCTTLMGKVSQFLIGTVNTYENL